MGTACAVRRPTLSPDAGEVTAPAAPQAGRVTGWMRVLRLTAGIVAAVGLYFFVPPSVNPDRRRKYSIRASAAGMINSAITFRIIPYTWATANLVRSQGEVCRYLLRWRM